MGNGCGKSTLRKSLQDIPRIISQMAIKFLVKTSTLEPEEISSGIFWFSISIEIPGGNLEFLFQLM